MQAEENKQKKKKEPDLKLFIREKKEENQREREQGNFEGSRYIKKMHKSTVPFSLDIIREEEEKKGF